jgi:hypothetical protein
MVQQEFAEWGYAYHTSVCYATERRGAMENEYPTLMLTACVRNRSQTLCYVLQ